MASSFKATHRFAPMSARKARPVADLVRGVSVNDALETLTFNPRRAAPLLTKVIRSAIANAAQSDDGYEARQLFVAEAFVDEGPLKQKRLRYRPGPMGRAMPIRKRTCHISVILGVAEEVEETPRPRRERKPKPEGVGAASEAEKDEAEAGSATATQAEETSSEKAGSKEADEAKKPEGDDAKDKAPKAKDD